MVGRPNAIPSPHLDAALLLNADTVGPICTDALEFMSPIPSAKASEKRNIWPATRSVGNPSPRWVYSRSVLIEASGLWEASDIRSYWR